MKYLCTIYITEDTLNAMTTDEYDTVVRECYAYEQTLREKGTLIAAEALEPIQTATTVRKRSDKSSITDGPFAETKEQLAGFFLIDVAEKKDAVDVASGMPQARIGSIEVRPIKNLYDH